MNKLFVAILLYAFPGLVLAQATGSLSFTPPSTDLSVFFLSNLFGLVDGVLAGTSGGAPNQILGAMFTVFNSAVLALGGIIIIYTLIVSTMNTAHEGQMLGQKWSSIWIPLRAVFGLGLLIPKASGYCLMQIFVMWIVVQGVGAADKIWNAALNYLNQGGVIISTQANNPADVLINATSSGIPEGAGAILTGQVCMLAIQEQLTAQRQNYLDATNNDKGPCSSGSDKKPFCDTPIPDFLGSVNAVDVQNQAAPGTQSFEMPMPNFKDGIYKKFNNICGTLKWNALPQFPSSSDNQILDKTQQQLKDTMSADDYKTSQLTRAIAIQQMFVDLSTIARAIVSNDPQIGTSTSSTKPYQPFATQQFGVPLTQNGTKCLNYSQNCRLWGPLDTGFGVLFNGTEFQGAINDYNGVMEPTINAIQKAKQQASTADANAFTKQAYAQGWIMAGAYFFDLIQLNTASNSNNTNVDTTNGLNGSAANGVVYSNLTVSKSPFLADWFEKVDQSYPRLEAIQRIIGQGVSAPDYGQKTGSTTRALVDGPAASTLFGFINNSLMIQLGQAPLQFANTMSFTVSGVPFSDLQPLPLNCDVIFCLDDMFVGLGYNTIFLGLMNYVLKLVFVAMQNVVNMILYIPLQGIGAIFRQGVSIISQPNVNPVVALANMGVMYINFAGDLYIGLLVGGAALMWAPPVFAILMLALPLIMAWMMIMVSISFITAYYIPILPYMMFIFGAIGWLISVIEAMVAAPLVALGITHPEGHDAFGKGEHAIMILLNVFLRPAMMIIGFIAAIALTYVGVWILNAGYDHAISYMQGGTKQEAVSGGSIDPNQVSSKPTFGGEGYGPSVGGVGGSWASEQGSGSGATKYVGWAGLFAFFFSILSYTTMYLIIVQKAFNLISDLPDKVLRWIGGQQETVGQQAAQWGEEGKSATKDAGDKSFSAQQQVGKSALAGVQKARGELKKESDKPKGGAEFGPDSDQNPPDGGGGGAPPGGGGGGMPPGAG